MWQQAPKQLNLTSQSVDLWLVNCQDYFSDLGKLYDLLSPTEQLRANRFKFPIHQHRFIVNRSNLRIILSKYLSIAPKEIEFDYTDKGKPYLTEAINNLELNFNVSHSQNYVIYGVSKNLIGVDIEEINPKINCQDLAKRFFCPQEFEIISNLPSPDNYRAFYLAWTSKEAYLKAIGTGLVGGLNSLELEILVTENKTKIIKCDHKNFDMGDWQLFNWVFPENFISTVAIFSKKNIIFKHYINRQVS